MFYMSIYEKKRLSQIFFKKIAPKLKKIHIFSEINFLEKKIEKKIFSSLKFGKFFLQKIKL